jgi:hypothetical protein
VNDQPEITFIIKSKPTMLAVVPEEVKTLVPSG